jgi:hypothetical protein
MSLDGEEMSLDGKERQAFLWFEDYFAHETW